MISCGSSCVRDRHCWPRPGIARLQLSRAKHPSLQGHARLAQTAREARSLLRVRRGSASSIRDDAPADVAVSAGAGFDRLAPRLRRSARRDASAARAPRAGISDLQFTRRYRVPLPVQPLRRAQHLRVGVSAANSSGRQCHRSRRPRDLRPDRFVRRQRLRLRLLQGVHRRGHRARRASLGPLLGAYHPVVEENVRAAEGDLRAGRGVVPHVGHRSGDAGGPAGAVSYRTFASGALLRRVPRLVGRCAAGRRHAATARDDVHAEGHVRGHAARARQPPRHRLRARQPAAGAASERRRARRRDARSAAIAARASIATAYARWLQELRAVCTSGRSC